MPNATRLIIVDDDRFSAGYMHQVLAQQQMDVIAVPTAMQAQALMRQHQAALVLLDVTLPDASGFDVCHWLRATYADVGIMFVSGHTGVDARLHAFDVGADDFLTKPFMTAELVARVRALLRRRGEEAFPQMVQVGGVVLHLADHTLTLPHGTRIPLTASQVQIMRVLLARPGQLVLRTDLARHVWGEERGNTLTAQRAVEAHVQQLADAIEPDPQWVRYIQIVRHVGARFIGVRG